MAGSGRGRAGREGFVISPQGKVLHTINTEEWGKHKGQLLVLLSQESPQCKPASTSPESCQESCQGPSPLGIVISPGFIFSLYLFIQRMVGSERVTVFKDSMAPPSCGISRPAPAPSRHKFLAQGGQAPQVTSLGTLPQAGWGFCYCPH